MKRERDLERQLRSAQSLSHTVGALKTLSAHHFRESRAALPLARAYRSGIEGIAEQAGASLPPGPSGAGLLVLGSDRGLCGGYNRDVALVAALKRHELGDGPTLCVGVRARGLLTAQGIKSLYYRAPASVAGITPLLLSLTQDLLTQYVTGGLASFHIVASRFEGVGNHTPVTTELLPIVGTHAPPPCYSTPDRLVAVAVRELLFTRMYATVIDALASEQGARLVATQAAEAWLEKRIVKQKRQLVSARREASTQEVIEIVAGARHGQLGRRR